MQRRARVIWICLCLGVVCAPGSVAAQRGLTAFDAQVLAGLMAHTADEVMLSRVAQAMSHDPAVRTYTQYMLRDYE
ncbi:MAG TPA: hypothetical protein VFH51_03365, partial [Myxococcota bacterium]|nr:hypothetical protein [Myxococcota bacterium]